MSDALSFSDAEQSPSSGENEEDEKNNALAVIAALIKKMLMPQAETLGRDRFKVVAKKASEKVMSEFQLKLSKKRMTVHQFLNPRRQIKIKQLVDKYVERV